MLLLTTTILQCPSELSNELISLWSKCNALRTIYRPSESISPKDFRFCFVVPAQLYQSATRLEQNTATWLKLWAIGNGILAMGWSVRLYHKLSPCPAGQKSQLSIPYFRVLSWDSLDLSSAASRRLYSVHLCSSVPISGK